MKVDSSPDSYIGSVAGGPQKAAEKPAAVAELAAAGAPTAKPQGVTVTLSPPPSRPWARAATRCSTRKKSKP